MKKILILTTYLLMFILADAQKTNKIIKVTQIIPTTWVERTPVTNTVTSDHKGRNTAIGSGVGWLLVGGPIGIIGGGLLGSGATSNYQSTTYVTYNEAIINGYFIQLSDGTSIRTCDKYLINQIVDPSKIKPQ